MGRKSGLIVGILLGMSLSLSVLRFVRADPMKRALFLVGSLIFLLPPISYSLHVWYRYYICLLFLSGIFVVIVYFSSLRGFRVYEYGLRMMIFVRVGLGTVLSGGAIEHQVYLDRNSLNFIVEDVYWFVYVWVVGVLLIFLGFMRYFLSFEGALRKI